MLKHPSNSSSVRPARWSGVATASAGRSTPCAMTGFAGRDSRDQESRRAQKFEQAYAALKDLLVNQRLPPGTPLIVRVLSERLGIGLTPLREALLQLSYEKLVDPSATRGFRVRMVQLAEVRDLFDFAHLILRQGVMTERALAAPASWSLADEASPEARAAALEAVYMAIAELNGNASMVETVQVFMTRTRCVRLVELESDASYAEAARSVGAVVQALAAKRPHQAAVAISDHFERQIGGLRAALKEILARSHGIHAPVDL